MLLHFEDSPLPKKKIKKEKKARKGSAAHTSGIDPPAPEVNMETDNHTVALSSVCIRCSHRIDDSREGNVYVYTLLVYPMGFQDYTLC